MIQRMMKMTMNSIITMIVEYYSSFTEDTEICTSEALKRVCGFEQDSTGEYLIAGEIMEFDNMFKLDYEVRKEARKAGMVIDDSLYADMVTGLPFHIPYIVKNKGFFFEYQNEPNPEHWCGFPELMWELGFEMDCYNSAPKIAALDYRSHSEKEIQDHLLKHMNDWTTQEVGNYVFSRYRELTHWSDYGYPEERGGYFFKRAFHILQMKLGEEWEERYLEPEFDEFTALVTNKFINAPHLQKFALSDEGQFHLKAIYNDLMQRLEKDEINVPILRNRCIKEVAEELEGLY